MYIVYSDIFFTSSRLSRVYDIREIKSCEMNKELISQEFIKKQLNK